MPRALPALHDLDAAAQRELCRELGETAFSEYALAQLRRAKPAQFDELFASVAELATPLVFDEALHFALQHVEKGSAIPDALPGWDLRLRQWLTKVAHRFPDELNAHADRFAESSAEVVAFCLYQQGKRELPLAVGERLARHFLNAAASRYAFEGQIPLAEIAAVCERLLFEQRFPVLQRARAEQLLPFATPRLRLGLAVNYCGQEFRSFANELLVTAESASDTELLLSLIGQLIERTPSVSLEGSIVLALCWALLGGNAETLPEFVKQYLLLDLRSGSLDDVEVTEAALRKLGAQYGGHTVQALLADTLREQRTTVLVPALAGAELVLELLERLDRGEIEPELAEKALVRSGAHVVAQLIELSLQKKRGAAFAGVAARVFAAFADAHAAPVLVQWMGHTSKGAAQAARKALLQLGDAALPALQEGAASTRREVRESSQALLGRFALQQPSDETPLQRVALAAQGLDAERADFLRRCHSLAELPQKWPALLRPKLLQHGALTLHWLRDWFNERVPRHDSRLWCYVVSQLRHDKDAIWVACDSFARLPHVPTSAWSGPREALALAGPLLAEPLTHLLTHVASEQREPLYKLLARHVYHGAQPLLVTGLLDTRKSIRTLCLDGLSRLPNADVQAVAVLLTTSGQGTRLCAAELLAVWGRGETKDAVLAALAEEKNATLRWYLEEALVACDGAEQLLGAPAVEGEAFEKSVDDFLAARPSLKLPRFLERVPLPELRFASGGILSDASALGFLACATQVDFTWKGRLLRLLKSALDPQLLAAWSEFVHQRWARAKDTSQKWAVLQLWVLASDAGIEAVAANLSKLRSSEHLAVASYLKVLEWRASSESISWLFHWWNALRSQGLRNAARELLGRAAFRKGLNVDELCAGLDVWICDTHDERVVDSTEGVSAVLEQSLLSGRGFSVALLRSWADRFPDALKGVLFEAQKVTSDGALKVKNGAAVPATKFDAPETPAFSAVPEVVCWHEQQFESIDGVPLLASGGPDVESDNAPKPASAPYILHVLHPWLLTPEQNVQWSNRLATRGTTPSFPQLGRTTYLFGGEQDLPLNELATDSKRLEAWRRAEHWLHGVPVDQGLVNDNSRRIAARGVVAHVEHTGYTIGEHEDADPVAILQLRFETLQGSSVEPDTLDPVVYSELCLSLSRVTAASSKR